jgi:Uma2 family endonuclease
MVDEAWMLVPPIGGWSTRDLDAWPVSNRRCQLTDGALTVLPSLSGLHQAVVMLLFSRLDPTVPPDLAVIPAMKIRFDRQLTRIVDLLVVPVPDPARHWFAPDEVLLAIEIESPGSHVEDRFMKPALYAAHGIPHFWRIELDPIRVRLYRLGSDEASRQVGSSDERISVDEPFPVDVALTDLLPRWAR